MASADSASAVAEKISSSVAEWQQRLLQLDRRNNLLYFRETRTTVGVTAPGPDELERLLQGRRSGLKFPYVEPTRRTRDRWAEPDEEQAARTLRVTAGDIEVDAEPGDLQRRLGNLHRRDKEWEEEQGLNVLFLAVGFLHWVDDDGETARSPILLLACDLERASPRDPYYLKREDDDVVVNATLRNVLGKRGLELPDLPDEETPEGYLARLKKHVARRKPEWTVSSEVSLGIFQFSKLAMWEDLEQMRTGVIEHSLIRRLAGAGSNANIEPADSASSPFDRADDVLVGGGMDDLLELRRQFTILPADFSQLRAIEQARAGQHLVIHGPPGTGKSQSIANLIATLLADGKRVLFVSEKTAALDVVKRQLEQAGLGTFCLDLHSERAKKNSVYAQLGDSLTAPTDGQRSEMQLIELEQRRAQLNTVVRALHRPQTKLNLTPYQVHGAYAKVQDAPVVRHTFRGIEDLEPDDLSKIRESAASLAARPDEFRDHYSSHWRPLILLETVASLAELVTGDMEAVLQATAEAGATFTEIARVAGVPAPDSAESLDQLADVLSLLASGPDGAIPIDWLRPDRLDSVAQLASNGSSLEVERTELEQKHETRWLQLPLGNTWGADADALETAPGEQSALSRVGGRGWERWLVSVEQQSTATAQALDSAGADAARSVASLSSVLGLAEGSQFLMSEVRRLSGLATEIATVGRIPEVWVKADLEQLGVDYEEALGRQTTLRNAEDSLHELCDPSAIDLDDSLLLSRFRTEYGSFFRRLTGSYRADRDRVRQHLRSREKPSVDIAVEVLERVRAVRLAREEWDSHSDPLRLSLGDLFVGEATDFARIGSSVKAVRDRAGQWRGMATTIRERWTDREACEQVATEAPQLAASLDQLEELTSDLGGSTALGDQRRLSDVLDDLRVVRSAVERTDEVVRAYLGDFISAPDDLPMLQRWIEDLIRLQRIEAHAQTLDPELQRSLGDWFATRSTDWPKVLEAIAWAAALLDAVDQKPTRDLLARVSERDSASATAARTKLADSRARLDNRLNALNERFDVGRTEWPSWAAAPLSDLSAWASKLLQDAPRAASWVEYSSAVQRVESLLGDGIVDALRNATDVAEEAPPAIDRLVFQSWIDRAHHEEPALKNFSTTDFERLRASFRELDGRFIEHARTRVRAKCLERYPDAFQTQVNAGEIGILRREIQKARRKMPVRRLLRRIPGLLTSLKPCFMMSPLAVSQLLPRNESGSESNLFDVVIFDEASQVFPEDAIPAIARANQLVVVGDTKQLPPTSFFRRRDDADDDDYDDELDVVDLNQLRDQESILHAMVGLVGQGVAESHLTVHYRSRHESLIRFSNHYFYEDRLLVFPSPELEQSGHGIVDRYVSGATFDSGGTQTNRREAEAVADEVVKLARTHGRTQSIGVVAMSRKQAELIREIIELRILTEPDIAEVLTEAGDEPFFVKNLENVQGDERDQMILSIGYGPVAGSSMVPNRFGPLTNPGGERRLNVAITRARETLTVFRSLQPGDIRTETGRMLRRFLEYVRAPATAIEAEVSELSGEEAENPFEESVGRALIERGYKISYQVGVSGYRIDIGIIGEENNEYVLGVECDGATYHSSPAARDRDWLRQSVLEGLGWTIHRIWSTSWVRNRADEIARLEQAIRRAEARASAPVDPVRDDAGAPVETQSTDPTGAEPAEPMTLKVADSGESLRELFDSYEVADLSDLKIGPELVNETQGRLTILLRRVIEAESPVHVDLVVERLRARYGHGRAGRQIRERILNAVFDVVRREYAWEGGQSAERRKLPSRPFIVEEDSVVRPRVPGAGQSARPIVRICDAELEAGILAVLTAIIGDTEESLIRNVSLAFGFKRVGADIRSAVGGAITRLLARGDLKTAGEMIELA